MKGQIEEAEDVVGNLSDLVMKASKIRKLKYPFLKVYLSSLVGKWRSSNSKYEVHMLDLQDFLIVDFNEHGKRLLQEMCFYLEKCGLGKLKRRYCVNTYNLVDFLSGKSSGLSIKTLKGLKSMLVNLGHGAMKFDELEKHICGIRTRRSRYFTVRNGLPIRLCDDDWAHIFGLMLDSRIKMYYFFSKSERLRKECKSVLERIGCDVYEHGGIVAGNSVFSDILSLSGINIHAKQTHANNALPFWVYTKTSERFKKILVSRAFDAEGYANENAGQACIVQATKVDCNGIDTEKIKGFMKLDCIKPSGVEILHVKFGSLPDNLRNYAIRNPPLILVSFALVLRQLNINSELRPERAYIGSDEKLAIIWKLHMFGQDMRKFKEIYSEFSALEKFDSAEKDRKNYLHRNTKDLYHLILAKTEEMKTGYFTIDSIIKLSDTNPKNIWNNIPMLKRKGLVENIGKVSGKNVWKITENGIMLLKDCQLDSIEEWNRLFVQKV